MGQKFSLHNTGAGREGEGQGQGERGSSVLIANC